MIIVWLALLTTLAGCTSSNIAAIVDAMAKDQASVCLKVNANMGVIQLSRSGITNGAMVCNPDGGMTITTK